MRLFSRAVGSCASSTSLKRLFRSKTLFERQTGFVKCVSGQKVPNRSEQTELHRNDWKIPVDCVSEELKSWPPNGFPIQLNFEPWRARFVSLQVATGASPTSTDLRSLAPTYFSSSCRAGHPYRPPSPRICAALVETSALAKKVCFPQTYCQNAVADKHNCVSGARER